MKEYNGVFILETEMIIIRPNDFWVNLLRAKYMRSIPLVLSHMEERRVLIVGTTYENSSLPL